MDLGDNQLLVEYAEQFRKWAIANTITRNSNESEPAFLKRWHQTLFAGGWVGASWPTSLGGLGLTAAHEAVLNEVLAELGAPDAPRIGYLGRAIREYGTPDQQARFIKGLLSGDDYWCQGFSEPEAGSDLANVSCRAERRGDTYFMSGQKLWSSYADYADYCLLLARTGEPGGRHRGISAFILPMSLSGVEVRPMRAITGELEFCEVFLDDVEVGVEQRLGAEGDGWAIAMMTVAYERGAADVGYLSRFGSSLRQLKQLFSDVTDLAVAAEIGQLEMHYCVLRYHVRRRMSERAHAQHVPGPEMSIDKILMTTVDQTMHEMAVRLLGQSALVNSGDNDWFRKYLYSRGASIYGGSQQIQLNVIADRLLGLPKAR